MSDVTRILNAIERGDAKATDELLPLVYAELRLLAAQNLHSLVVITDGVWHRVGLVWDGSKRTLYADDVEVASDSRNGLAPANDELYIGAGSKPGAGPFWSGLIDDVRIYSQAVKPWRAL